MKSIYYDSHMFDCSLKGHLCRLIRVAHRQMPELEKRIPQLVCTGRFSSTTRIMREEAIAAAYSDEELVRIGDQFAKALEEPPVPTTRLGRIRSALFRAGEAINDFLSS